MKSVFNHPVSIKSKVLTAAVTISMLGTLGIATANANSTDRQAEREARMEQKLAMTIEAASTTISAEQAVQIAQNQVSGSTVMGVHYTKGDKVGRRGGRSGHRGMRGQSPNQDQTTQSTADKTPSYHVGLVDSEGKRYHVSIDANTGNVLKKEEMQRPERRGNRANQTATSDKQRPAMQKPAVSITQAMRAAESKLGGEAVGARFGKMGRHHGQRSEGQQKQANNMSERPAPSYYVQVVKSGEVYFAKVDTQTGQVTDTQTLEEMKADMKEKRAEHQSRRGGRR